MDVTGVAANDTVPNDSGSATNGAPVMSPKFPTAADGGFPERVAVEGTDSEEPRRVGCGLESRV